MALGDKCCDLYDKATKIFGEVSKTGTGSMTVCLRVVWLIEEHVLAWVDERKIRSLYQNEFGITRIDFRRKATAILANHTVV
jgi:hypothetical protein